MEVALYIYINDVARRIELFEDEKISITSSIQNINNISKVFTDFSQQFTVPASTNNNEIFKHWYENSIDGGFDHRVKYKGFIEIDTIPFRYGGFALNNVQTKNNRIENYGIVFYGDTKNISDLVKEDKLNSLDFSELNHSFTATEVRNRIDGTTNDNVKYPLLAHDRIYDYNNASANDVTTTSGAILWRSLFPAIPVTYIMQKIQDKYNINFTGAFLNYTQFNKLHLLFKNAETLTVPTLSQKINFTTKSSQLTNAEVNLTTDEIGFRSVFDLSNLLFITYRRLRIVITPTTPTQIYTVEIRKNGAPFLFFNNLTGTTSNTFFMGVINSQSLTDKYTIYISSNVPMTYTSRLDYQIGTGTSALNYVANSPSTATQSNIDIGRYTPEIKIMDFLNGLIKMFNLVIIPQNETTFELIPLELYYNNGAFKDISKNVITDDIDIKKTSAYKNINFNFESSENILNTKFRELFTAQRGFDYGDLKYEQIDSLESATYEIKLPFENPMFERKSNSNFQTLTLKNKDLNNYVPKPILMYLNPLQSVAPDIKFNQEGSITNIGLYNRFSNEIFNGTLMSLNWGAEISTWELTTSINGLYQRHYSNYIGNIFDLKARLIVVKCKFNPVELSNIKLNDRIIIRDKKYTINTMKCDLITGEVDMELLSDYRTIGQVTIGARYSFEDNYQVPAEESTFEMLVLMADSLGFESRPSEFDWITYSLEEFNENGILNVNISENTTGVERTGYVSLRYNYGDTLGVQIPIIQNA
jgi:hypothetical protein